VCAREPEHGLLSERGKIKTMAVTIRIVLMVPHIAYLHRNTHTRYYGKLAISATHKQKRKNKKHHQIPMKLNWKTSERAMSTYNQKHRTKKLIFIKSVRLSRKKPAREQKKVTGEPDQPSLCGRKKTSSNRKETKSTPNTAVLSRRQRKPSCQSHHQQQHGEVRLIAS
jgi:hypothetical protein